jgi:RNA polymerase sigma-70 factor (family 1)
MLIAPPYDENDLLLQASTGDRQAFTQLYKAYLNNCYNYIFLFTKSQEETGEILQEVFVKIWEGREKLANVQSFKNYLLKSAKNKLLDHVRKEQIRHRVLTEIKRNNSIVQETTNDDFAYREYYRIVQQAIEKLPPKRKLIFRLNTENGLSHNEIAEQLNISKSVVKNQLYKACDFVRQYLSKHGEFSFYSAID